MRTSPVPKAGSKRPAFSFRALLSRHWIVFAGFAAIGGYFLWSAHRVHIMQFGSWLPWLLIALCPLMHIFMHHGHGHGNGHGDENTPSKPDTQDQ